MTEEEVKGLLKEASEKIKDDFIPSMTNLLMDVFQYGLNAGTDLGAKIVNDKFDSKTQSCINWQTGEATEGGYYLITTTNGRIDTDHWLIFPNRSCWEYRNKFDVKAWCKISDIEPYKEEQNE